jgi:hypothetical protein
MELYYCWCANVEIFKERFFFKYKKRTILIFGERKMKNLVKIFGNIFIIFQHQIFKIKLIIWWAEKMCWRSCPCTNTIFAFQQSICFALCGRPWLMTRVWWHVNVCKKGMYFVCTDDLALTRHMLTGIRIIFLL